MLWFALILIVVFTLSYCTYWIGFYNPENRHGEEIHTTANDEERLRILCAEMEAIPFERVYIQSKDGLRLSARYYHVDDHANLHIQFHGYRGSGIRDFGAVHSIIRRLGQNALVVDQRAHGKSQGNTMTFGIKERFDCQQWVEYAVNRFGANQRIFLSGVSMGAATVLMASELELPANVVGIIADCSYSSPGAIIRKVCDDMKFPPMLTYPFVVLGALVFGRFCLWASSPKDAVRNTDIPVLLIHGKEDKFVPCEMSSRIFDACRSVKYLEVFPGAAHCGCCLTDPKRYEQIIDKFMKQCLSHNEKS